jgi:hypothetical protein
MGVEHSSISYHRVPNPILVFGPTKNNGFALDKLKSTITTLDDIVSKIDTVVQKGNKFFTKL